MTEFSTSTLLEVEVSQSSLRDARSTIEDELGDITVDVSASASDQASSGGGSRLAGKERAMTRNVLSNQSDKLVDQLDVLEQSIELDETRNDLLRDLVDAQERTARSSGDGNMIRNLGGAVLGLAGGGLAIAGILSTELANVNWMGVIGDAIPDLNPGSVVDAVSLTASDVIEQTASISPSNLVAAGATVGAGALIASGATVGAAPLVATAATVTAASVIASKANITPGDVIGSAASVGAGVLVASAATVVAGDVIASQATISAVDVIASGADVGAGVLVATAATITASALIGSKAIINVDDLLNRDGSESNSSNTGVVKQFAGAAMSQGAFTLDMLQGAGDFAADNAAEIGVGAGVAGAARGLASRFPASSGALAMTRDQYMSMDKRGRSNLQGLLDSAGLDVNVPDRRNRSQESRDVTMSSENQRKQQAHGTQSRANRARESRAGKTEMNVEQTVEFDTSSLERELSKLNRDLLQRLQDLESELESMRSGSTRF